MEEIFQGFEEVWQLYPVKQNQKTAKQIFASMARQGKLPAVEELLNVIKTFIETDKRWRAGCIPTLNYWLKDERWNDEPLIWDNKNTKKDEMSKETAYSPTQLQEMTQKVLSAMENRTPPPVVETQIDYSEADKISTLILSKWEQSPLHEFTLKGYCRTLFNKGILPAFIWSNKYL